MRFLGTNSWIMVLGISWSIVGAMVASFYTLWPPPGQLPNLCLFNLRRRVGCFMMTSHEVLVAKKQIRHLTQECLHSWVYQESIHTLWGNWIVLVSRSWRHWKYLRDKAKHKHNQTKTDVYTTVTFVPAEGSLPAMGQEMIKATKNDKVSPASTETWREREREPCTLSVHRCWIVVDLQMSNACPEWSLHFDNLT